MVVIPAAFKARRDVRRVDQVGQAMNECCEEDGVSKQC
jgi:hypothetical protein